MAELEVEFEGRLSDGRTAGSRRVRVRLARAVEIMSEPGAVPELWAFHRLAVGTPVTRHSRDILLKSLDHGGATLFIADAKAAAALAKRAPQLSARAERWRIAKPGIAFFLLAAAVTAAVYFLDLSPAQGIARLLPHSARAAIGEQALASFTEGRKVCRSPAGDAALVRLAAKLSAVSGAAEPFDIRVVDWDLVNAFALPGGHVALNRGLIEKAQSPDEVAGVLAHEMGHGLELHPEAGIVRALGISFAMQLMFSGSAGSLGDIGAVLLQLSYTRGAEREADGHALRILKEARISPKPLADFFRRLSDDEIKVPGGPLSAGDLFTTHPPSPERAEAAETAATYASEPVMSNADWQALRVMCS